MTSPSVLRGTIESEYCWPPLSVARQPIRAMAEAAVSIVLEPQFSLPAITLRTPSRYSRVMWMPEMINLPSAHAGC